MAVPARKIRSHAVPISRPAGMEETGRRPHMHVVVNEHYNSQVVLRHMSHFVAWAKSRSAPLLYVVTAIVFLVCALVGSLFLRTMMAENSFQSMHLNNEISVLQQDVQNLRSQLDTAEAQLPLRAEQMGMVPENSSVTIDLQGYEPPVGQEVK